MISTCLPLPFFVEALVLGLTDAISQRFHTLTLVNHQFLTYRNKPVLRIRIGFSADPDTSDQNLDLDRDPDPGGFGKLEKIYS
jgi:hypothetical protein